MQKSETSSDLDELNRALDRIENNLTGQDISKPNNSEEVEPNTKVDEDYQAFLQDIRNQEHSEEVPENSIDVLGFLVKGLSEALGNANSKGEQDFKLPGQEQNSRQEEQDEKILDSFFKKQLIQQSILQTKEQFQAFLKKSTNLQEDLQARYRSQIQILEEMIEVIGVEPESKPKLLNLYQEYFKLGFAPAGILQLPFIE